MLGVASAGFPELWSTVFAVYWETEPIDAAARAIRAYLAIAAVASEHSVVGIGDFWVESLRVGNPLVDLLE